MQITLQQTCYACPEAYDAYYGDTHIGYLRLRHGCFTVDFGTGDISNIVYTAYPKGDGVFCSDERDYYLDVAKDVLRKCWIIQLFKGEEG